MPITFVLKTYHHTVHGSRFVIFQSLRLVPEVARDANNYEHYCSLYNANIRVITSPIFLFKAYRNYYDIDLYDCPS